MRGKWEGHDDEFMPTRREAEADERLGQLQTLRTNMQAALASLMEATTLDEVYEAMGEAEASMDQFKRQTEALL